MKSRSEAKDMGTYTAERPRLLFLDTVEAVLRHGPMNDADIIARARDYPYAQSPTSYVWDGIRTVPLAATSLPEDLEARTPVLALGGNASPSVFAHAFPGQVTPVLRATLADFDLVYMARFEPHGAMPAMLAPSPGTVATVFVAFLSPDQRDWLTDIALGFEDDHGPFFTFGELQEIALDIEGLGGRDRVFTYRSAVPAMGHDGAICAYSELPAKNRRLPDFAHPRVLEAVRERQAPDLTFDDFLVALVKDDALRARCTTALRANAVPVELPSYTQILPKA